MNDEFVTTIARVRNLRAYGASDRGIHDVLVSSGVSSDMAHFYIKSVDVLDGDTEVCKCECHVHGGMHIVACCDSNVRRVPGKVKRVRR